MGRFEETARRGFISVGAVCQRWSASCFLGVVRFVLSLVCLAKRKQALRGRNLPRDSQAKGAPRARRASGVHDTPAALFVPLGHPCHASENPNHGKARTLESTRSGWPRVVVVALGLLGGIIAPILRRRSGATRRVNSSLRSHRTWRSQCRPVSSGLNKTLFASVGPNLRCRGHRSRCPAEPGRLPLREESRCQAGRIKPGRGHRHDGMPRARSLAPVRDIARIPPHVMDCTRIGFITGFRPLISRRFLGYETSSTGSCRLLVDFAGTLCRPGLVGGGGPTATRTALVRLLVADHGIQHPQEATAHGHVGLGLHAAGATDDSLNNRSNDLALFHLTFPALERLP
jgi:hypothetical protein